jgi:glycerol-3-phosphate dehydrogenase (NAD(P)+)
MEPVAVIGAGSWGTALALLLAEKGHPVRLWAHGEKNYRELADNRENLTYLPGYPLPANLTPTRDLAEAVHGVSLVLSVAPSHAVRDVMSQAGPYIPREAIVISASKGIENDSLKTMDGVLHEVLPDYLHSRLTYLSGPSFAREVAQKLATVVIVASADEKIAMHVQETLNGPYFRVYRSTDVIGTEIAGALKNVMAIATGAIAGFGLGDNARAATITRGLAEITRLGVHLGADPMTFLGLAGMGDLVLTCTGEQSRNRRVGFEIGRGRKLAEVLAEMKMVAEGVKTARSAHDLALRHCVDMPITDQVYQGLYHDKPMADVLSDLMGRSLKTEWLDFPPMRPQQN